MQRLGEPTTHHRTDVVWEELRDICRNIDLRTSSCLPLDLVYLLLYGTAALSPSMLYCKGDSDFGTSLADRD